ncbi:MAG: NAD(P)-binding domain-containing protein, partial [Actinomycetota bacterium]|nr:NAD(P)-binding domain-containing protein [Actinomycetota bacterium]
MPAPPRRSIHLPAAGARRAVVVGAGSFGTAIAVLLARGGLRTTLQARTPEQAQRLTADRENRVYLPGVELPRELRIEHVGDGLARADLVLLGVPSNGLSEVIQTLEKKGLTPRAAVVSLAKGLVAPVGAPPTALLSRKLGRERTGCVGGPAHAREMVSEGAALVAASTDEMLASSLAAVFIRAGVVCE